MIRGNWREELGFCCCNLVVKAPEIGGGGLGAIAVGRGGGGRAGWGRGLVGAAALMQRALLLLLLPQLLCVDQLPLVQQGQNSSGGVPLQGGRAPLAERAAAERKRGIFRNANGFPVW